MSLDLRTGRSVWFIDEKEQPRHESLKQDISSEIAVIGGGINGALIAHRLTNMGMKVILVDSRDIALGSTFASTAILSYETDVLLGDLIKKIGEESAVRVFRAGIEAIDYIEEVISELDEDCDFKRRNSVYFASTESDAKSIEEEYLLRKRYGFDLRFLSREEFKVLFSFDVPCALLTPRAAQVNPVKLTRALIKTSIKKGLKVFSDTKIEKYNAHETEPSAVTDKGHTIVAKHFIFATGYETEQFLKQKKVKLLSTYAIASEPVESFPGLYERSTIWETASPYLYIRTTTDNRIIVGGEDVNFFDEKKRDKLLSEKAKILQDKFQKMFPKITFKLSTVWTGTFAESEDSLPYIGVHKDFPGAFFSLGYGGNGTTFAAMASRIIPDLILGKDNNDADIFSFDR